MERFKGEDEQAQKLAEALLPQEELAIVAQQQHDQTYEEQSFGNRFWLETKKLWIIVGPSIFSRLAAFNMNVVTQAFAGHLGEVELAAISIANTVIVGFNFGLLRVGDTVWASVWGEEIPHVGYIHAEVMDCSVPVLFRAVAALCIRDAASEVDRTTGGGGGVERCGGGVADSSALQFCVSVPAAKVPAVPDEDGGYCVGFLGGFGGECGD
ncbi:unnamed protein product [Sphenostylis stenocarpa]|uniref:Uncharacterized protein n=1 Tax=Sphenostylis stenocarpa TaxID=92480 RepID=A0AA86VTC8_9FABA|nr:unnamed protein product [Sphenostylis stenocarpa]